MADLFSTGIQIPNVQSGTVARPADTGFIRVYSKENVLYGVLPDGTETPLSGGGNLLSVENDSTEVASDVSTMNFTGDGVEVTDQNNGSVQVDIKSLSDQVFVGDLPPPNPEEFPYWYNTLDGNTYFYYDDGDGQQYVPSNSIELVGVIGSGGGSGSDGDNDIPVSNEGLQISPVLNSLNFEGNSVEATADGGDITVTVNVDPADTSKIESNDTDSIQTKIQASDDSLGFFFNDALRADLKTDGASFFPNTGNPYSFRFFDSGGTEFAGLRAPTNVKSSYFTKLPEELGSADQLLTVKEVNGNVQRLGYVEGAHPIDVYNSGGLVSKSTRIKQWVGSVQSNGDGVFNVDWSSAGFSSIFNIQVTCLTPQTGTVTDRAWATMTDNFDINGGVGYTLRGQVIISILVGGAATVRTAPNRSVNVVVWGV